MVIKNYKPLSAQLYTLLIDIQDQNPCMATVQRSTVGSNPYARL